MKKLFVFMSVTALALVSCVKTQVVYTGNPESREIAFSPLAQNATKAGASTATSGFPTDSSFYLAAYVAGNPGYDHFDKTVFSYNSGTWKGGQYWPIDEVTLNFLAITKQGNAPTVNFGTGETPANFVSQVVAVLSNNKPKNDSQHDLMFAYNRSSTKNSPVTLEFKHALAWVYFTARSNAGSAITITGITLNGAKYSGTATIALSNYSSPSETLSHTLTWGPLGSAENVAVPGISSQVLTTSAADCGDGLMVVPDPTNDSFTSFTVNYTMNGHAYSKVVTPDSKTLTYGHKYVYDIEISLSEISVTATVSDWGVPNS
jgi:hypothetical protein